MSRKRPCDLKLLSLSTAEQGCSLAVVDGASLVCEEFWTTKTTHSRRLVGMIRHMLENRAGLKPDDIDGFVVANGPGGFTGLRIGISVIKGLSYAMDKPVAGVSSLDGIAFRFACSSIPVCVMMDARRGEVYCSVYCFNNNTLVAKTPETVVRPEDAVALAKGESVLFVGSGSKAYRGNIEQEANHPVFTRGFSDSVSAAALIQSLYSKEQDFFESGNNLVPRYIRASDAELHPV